MLLLDRLAGSSGGIDCIGYLDDAIMATASLKSSSDGIG
jgi:hypothetical protein